MQLFSATVQLLITARLTQNTSVHQTLQCQVDLPLLIQAGDVAQKVRSAGGLTMLIGTTTPHQTDLWKRAI